MRRTRRGIECRTRGGHPYGMPSRGVRGLAILVVVTVVAGCYRHHERRSPDAGRDAPIARDAPRPRDAPPPPDVPPDAPLDLDADLVATGCIVGPRHGTTDESARSYALTSGLVPAVWGATEPDGELAVASIGVGLVYECVAALRADLTVAWAIDVPPAEHLHLVHLGGQLTVVVLEGPFVRWAPIDASGALGAWREAPGFEGEYEWTEIAPTADGGFVAVWNEAWTIVARGYDPSGVPRGDVATVSMNGRYPSAARLEGRIVLGYHQLVSVHVTGPLIAELDEAGVLLAPPTAPNGETSAGTMLQLVEGVDGIVAAWTGESHAAFGHFTETLELRAPPAPIATGSMGLHTTDVRVLGPDTLVALDDPGVVMRVVAVAGGSTRTLAEWRDGFLGPLGIAGSTALALGDRAAGRTVEPFAQRLVP